MTAREDRDPGNTETLTGEDVGRVEDVLGDGTADARPPHDPDPHPEPGTVEAHPLDRAEGEGASAGQRVADAVPRGDMGRSMAGRGGGLADEDAPPIAEGVFVCLAHTRTGDVEQACGCGQFTRGAVVGLTTHGDEAFVVYTCNGCGARWKFQGSPVPAWQWVNR